MFHWNLRIISTLQISKVCSGKLLKCVFYGKTIIRFALAVKAQWRRQGQAATALAHLVFKLLGEGKCLPKKVPYGSF